MKKLILLILLAVMVLSDGVTGVQAQDIFGPANYFRRSNDSVFVKTGLVFGSVATVDAYTKAQSDARYLFKDSTNIAYKNTDNTFTGTIKANKFTVNGSGTPIPYFSAVKSLADTNIVGLNFVGANNVNRQSQTQAGDTSSFGIYLSRYSNNPYVEMRNNTGTQTFGIDTAGNVSGRTFVSSTALTTASTGALNFANRGQVTTTADGIFKFTNWASINATLVFGTATVTLLPTYADNAAATSGGLTAGQLYKTATGEVMVTY